MFVRVRYQRTMNFRVGICVGIKRKCFLLIILNHEVECYVRVRPSHHKNIKRRQWTSFFVSEIPVLQGFSPLFSLPKYTKVNPHQVPAVGICVWYLSIR